MNNLYVKWIKKQKQKKDLREMYSKNDDKHGSFIGQ